MSGRPRGSAAVRYTAFAALAVALGAECLHSVLTGNSWYPPVLAVIAVVAGLGLLGRRLSAPPAVAMVAQLLGVLVVCTVLYARGQAFAGFVPTPASVSALGRLVSAGTADLQVVLAPTYPRPDLTLLAVGGVGLLAVAVDLVAVGAGRPTLAGLPLVLLVAVPAAIRERSVGFGPLLATVLGFLLLISLDADERTSRWGRVLPNPGAMPSTAASNLGAGVQIGLASIALAVVVPLAIPVTSSPFSASGLGNGTGTSSAVIVDPLVSVAAQLNDPGDERLLTVRSPRNDYLRLTALEQFTDAGFGLGPVSAPTSARVSKGIAAPVGSPPTIGPSYTATITASDALVEMLLPVPAGTTAVKVDGDWRLSAQTGTIFSSNETTRSATWTVTATAPQPAAAALTATGGLHVPASQYADDITPDLTVPRDLPPALAQTATQWTAGARTAYEAAVAIQRHFTDGSFTYRTAGVTYPSGPEGFAQFLRQRVGFCQQYATTMAAMLRTLGIPARVAVGFLGGERQPDGSYAVTSQAAHAWPEVFFQGIGWVRFEPTPRSDGRATPPAYATGGGGPTAPTTGPSVAPAPSTGPSAGRTPGSSSLSSKLDNLGGGDGGARGVGAGRGGLPVWPWVALAAVLTTGVLLLPGALGAVRRRRRLTARDAGSVEGVWDQLVDDATDRGVVLAAADSPRGTGRRLLRVVAGSKPPPDGLRQAVGRIVAAVEQARYAPAAQDRSTEGLAADEVTVRRALAAGLPRGRRALAVALPATARGRLLRPVTSVVPAMLAGLDRVVGALRPRASG